MNIEKTIYDRLNFTDIPQITYENRDCVYVRYSDGKAVVSNSTKSFLTRGLTHLAKGISDGKKEFEICEKPAFEVRGLQLELSRNGVMRVSTVKKILEYMACCGLNSVVLYMEDVYQLKNYPYFGYMRGAYSEQELKEIDDYAYELGIEVVPAIQVLGHMEQYLRHVESAPVRGTDSILLCGDENTYTFIEEMISTMRRCFRGSKIHIGCDESESVALGNYIKKNGYRKSADIINEHVTRVEKIASKYGFKPIMYSDMYFKMYSKTGSQFDYDVEFPENISELVPNVDIAYWDYGQLTEEKYVKMMTAISRMGKKVMYFGGIWGWGDILPRYKYTFKGLIPGVKAAITSSIEDVYATTWGDDGNECNKMYEMFAMTVVSEICFKGRCCPMEEIYSMSEFLFGVKEGFFEPISEISMPYEESVDFGLNDTYYGKGLFYTDILYNLTGAEEFYREAKLRYIASSKELKGTITFDEYKSYEDFAVMVYHILALKAEIITNLRRAYKEGDKDFLKKTACELLPSLKCMYSELLPLWQKMWLEFYKPFGWEVINGRLGFVMARVDYAIETLNKYLDGKLKSIEELDAKFIDNKDMAPSPSFKTMVSTSITI